MATFDCGARVADDYGQALLRSIVLAAAESLSRYLCNEAIEPNRSIKEPLSVPKKQTCYSS